jgi:molybdenum cofactor synthesis domain-containing protein
MIRTAIITVSDTRQTADDLSGNKLVELVEAFGGEVIIRRMVTDDLTEIRDVLAVVADREDIDLVLTTGGTGFAPRDNTPEATRALIQREAPGLAEAMRRETAAKTPKAILSRGVSGIRGTTLIINLPGSPKGVEECFEVLRPILDHAIAQIRGDVWH